MTEDPESGAFDPTRPFTRAAAAAQGNIRDLRTPSYRRLLHGIYVAATVETTAALMAEAALLPFGEKAWASHATAARVLGLPIPALPGEHVTVVERRRRRGRRDVTCHLSRKGLVNVIGGVRVSAPQQVFIELATQLSLVDLVIVGDHLVRKGLVDLATLRAFCAETSGPGAALARTAVGYVRDGVDSPMETRLRLLIVLAGLPEPEVNLLVGDELERRKYDLSYRRSRTIIEYDGRQHVERIEQWEADLERREGIDDDQWRILVFVAKDIYKSPGRPLERIHRVLQLRGEPGVPTTLSDAWRAHFPGWS
ncbi:hypothetical protein J2S40_004177 [Nocardioides luteus]|uniref:DUF559 domain-containing protein n=1 Tax=Nocardioides luteus TaxID=1844 RepID=A0ABQ5SSJ7_9ACTN|nr:DUF559 domain-containing protein [Nocardioides luteus]MDR7313119.1 hypothetical protein [Nocardioides luteus]GGR43963.1 hypothetical protein GCM10010197_06800 [Nocardioides luteus]GLJ66181.1 hypothetical protein GCM10017579_02170 [Nocardioides luteus]